MTYSLKRKTKINKANIRLSNKENKEIRIKKTK